MKKLLTSLLFLLILFPLSAQMSRNITDKGRQGMALSYSFSPAVAQNRAYKQNPLVQYTIKDFSYLREAGKPALPVRYELLLIPEGAQASIQMKPSVSYEALSGMIYPALRPATDRVGDPEPEFIMDSAFYQTNTFYPERAVDIVKIFKIRGLSLALIRICPLQYNPKKYKIRFFEELNFTVDFKGKILSLLPQTPVSTAFLQSLQNVVLNAASLKAEMSVKQKSLKTTSTAPKNYIIITHNDYHQAADSLAKWKSQLGYSVQIVSRASWTSAQVKSEINSLYLAYNPLPDYFVILGDHDKVPGEIHQDPLYHDNFATDLYYACMDGTNDYAADMAFGRISVASAVQAMLVVNKIISYEKTPPMIPGFYTNGIGCAFYQDDDYNDHEDRRFLMTMEEIRNYMTTQGYNMSRVYKARDSANPVYYNDGFYANSEPLPNDLLRPGFLWNGSKTDIISQLNSANGDLFLAHRDHGYVGGSGWGYPQFVSNDIDLLNNGNKLPVVFSINCHTGEFQLPECFAEKFLRKSNGGAVGVFGAAYYSYSGFNDGLIEGMFDAIWASPGLVPSLSGNGDLPVGTPQPNSPIYTMGDVMNQGLLRMLQTWGDDRYTDELYHYFGDPAMRIWTAYPTLITSTHQNSLNCGDTSFAVFSSSCNDGLATLVVDGELVCSAILISGTATLHFPPIDGSKVVFTISKHNYQPYVANIPLTSQCLKAEFDISYQNSCVGESITITNGSAGNITSYSWDFGADAAPATATSTGPFNIIYGSPGVKTIALTLTDGTQIKTYADSINVAQPCVYTATQNHNTIISACQGTLYDNGGNSTYLSNSNDTIMLINTSIDNFLLHFTDFDVEMGDTSYCNYDYLEIYDGSMNAAHLMGKYCSNPNNLPPITFTSSSDTVTLHFYSDGYSTGRGFVIDFNCTSGGQAAMAGFVADPISTCDGHVQFTNLSTNAPTSYLWKFGDGNTSTAQNPDHYYADNGTYSVSLTAQNAFGDNTFSRLDYINNQRPLAPIAANYEICQPGSLDITAQATGNLNWYDQPIAGNPIFVGDTFATPVINTSTQYYVESEITEAFTTGAADTLIGSGAYYNGTTDHYLIFNCLEDITIQSVDVFAKTTGNRTILLKTPASIVYDTSIFLSAGKTTLNLNWFVTTGSNYRLVGSGPLYNLYRNNTGASYPYDIQGKVSITGNSYANPAYYYYFYNWKIKGNTCRSLRSPVGITVNTAVPTAVFNFTENNNTVNCNNLSQNGNTYLWDFGDGSSSNLLNPSHTYTSNGSYIITLTVTNACGTDIKQDTVDIYTVGIAENTSLSNILIHPNPAHNKITLSWNGSQISHLKLSLTDVYGQIIYLIDLKSLPGKNAADVDLSIFAKGIYFAILRSGKETSVNKLVIY
jgi:PKD repeat protein